MTAIAGPGTPARVSTGCGDLVGTWCGQGSVGAGADVDVELAVQRTYRWSEVSRSNAEAGFEVVRGDRVRLAARVVDHDELDVLTLSVAGTFLLLDVTGTAPLGVVGTTIEVTLDDLELWPTGV